MKTTEFDCLGIELGSTRIKAVLTGPELRPIASGEYTWSDEERDGFWSYPLGEVWRGLQAAYAAMASDAEKKLGARPESFGAIGVSAMMHGYLPFDGDGQLLTPFRTWRCTTTGKASEELSDALAFNIPQRWSAAHLYQAILDGEEHVSRTERLTTLAGYVHWRLTGRFCLGVGDASGMFPVDAGGRYDAAMLEKFDALASEHGFSRPLSGLLPEILFAGEEAGRLTPEGALLLDPTGGLRPGAPLCPPEGDAGTGMVCTNAVRPGTGNVSAGTSIFSMVVLKKPLGSAHPELDIVATPDGAPVAMVHCNNCTSDMNMWAELLGGTARLFGAEPETGELFTRLYEKSLEGEPDCGGVLVYNYLAGEPVTGFAEGRPMVVRAPLCRFTLANFLRAQLYSTMAALKLGMDILASEGVEIDGITGHGGVFKTPLVGQRYLAAAVRSPVSVMETAGEGGPYGMALLAAYMLRGGGASLADFLDREVFARAKRVTVQPDAEDAAGFERYLERYKAGLAAERAAVGSIR